MKNNSAEPNSLAAAIQRAQDVLVIEARDVSPHRSTTPARRGGHRTSRGSPKHYDEMIDHEPRSPVYYSNVSGRKKKKEKAPQGKSPSSASSSITPKAGSLAEQREDVQSSGGKKPPEEKPNKDEISRLHRLMAREKSKRSSSLLAKSQHRGLKSIPSQSTDASVADTSDANSVYGAASKSVASTNHSVTSNLLYQALRTGNSSSLSQTKSPGNLNRTLSSASDNFHDFHNPNIEYNTEEEEVSTLGDIRSLASSKLTPKAVPRPEPPKVVQKKRAVSPSEATISTIATTDLPTKSSRSYDSSEELTFYRFVAKHSILQLCTEDLMSDNWKRVDYALYRLGEVCCCTTECAGELKLAASNRIRFIKAGGHALLVGVMKKYSQSPDIQCSASRLIHQISTLDKDDSAFGELFASVDGLECVVSAIVRFPGANIDVHSCACEALTALVCSSPKMVRRIMQDPNHLRTYFAAMKAESSKNQIGTCRVLYLLSSQNGYCNDIVKAGGVDAIALEMKNHLKEKVVQIFGCWALANIAEHTDICATAMQEVGSLAIGMAMKTYPQDEKVQEKAVLALFHASLLAPQEIKKAGGLSSLGCALENFPASEAIQQSGSATIKRLLETTSQKKQEPKTS